MNRFWLFYLLLISSYSLAQEQPKPEINVIYGSKHIFTVNTPIDWVNDKSYAQSIGLVSYFYAKSDQEKPPRSYVFAMGYDKDELTEDLTSFIAQDLRNFRKKYPKLTYEEIEVGATGGIIGAKMLSFNDLSDRYKEEVIYMETDSSILIFSFSTFTKDDYQKYTPIFDSFVSSFKYRGTDPKPYLDWLKDRN